MSFYTITENILPVIFVISVILSIIFIVLTRLRGHKICNIPYKITALTFVSFLLLTLMYLLVMGFLYTVSYLFLF